jgi:hypothetical protein
VKNVTLYKPSGDLFRTYNDVSAVETTNGILRFRFERKAGDRSTLEAVETSLPFTLEDDLER